MAKVVLDAGALDRVGNTPLVKLESLSNDKVQYFAKLESHNPFGSVKDRAAYWMIKDQQSNWTGPAFKQYSEQQKQAAKDQYISMGRGTAKVKFGDVSSSTSTASTKGMWVGTGRGTGRRKL